jgi:hypothetical protein
VDGLRIFRELETYDIDPTIINDNTTIMTSSFLPIFMEISSAYF